jgi:hypothetical protein
LYRAFGLTWQKLFSRCLGQSLFFWAAFSRQTGLESAFFTAGCGKAPPRGVKILPATVEFGRF